MMMSTTGVRKRVDVREPVVQIAHRHAHRVGADAPPWQLAAVPLSDARDTADELRTQGEIVAFGACECGAVYPTQAAWELLPWRGVADGAAGVALEHRTCRCGASIFVEKPAAAGAL